MQRYCTVLDGDSVLQTRQETRHNTPPWPSRPQGLNFMVVWFGVWPGDFSGLPMCGT
jgi:hypothetical protein